MNSDTSSRTVVEDMPVSVIIPAYNAADTLRRAVLSCLNQSSQPLEIIIIDDGSSDDTFAIATSFPAPVRAIRQKNAGPGAARNAGARIAKGVWLAFLDADDWWMPEKLERQLLLAKEPGIDIIHTLTNNSPSNIPKFLSFHDLWRHNFICNSSAMIRQSVFRRLGGFDEHPDMFVCEDYNLWLRAAASGSRIVLCNELLTYYTVASGVSSNVSRFWQGTKRNFELIQNEYSIPSTLAAEKWTDNLALVGRTALDRRDMPLARKLLRQAFLQKPNSVSAFNAAISCLPRSVLDLSRRYSRRQPLFRFKGDHTSILIPSAPAQVHTPADRPAIMVVVDAELQPGHSSPGTAGGAAMREQHAAQNIFARHGIVPTYAIDSTVAQDPMASRVLREFLSEQGCEIGGLAYPGIHSLRDYQGNIPAYAEFEAVSVLTRAIQDNLGVQPILFHGGAGEYTAHILKHFGYRVDCSAPPLIFSDHNRWSDHPGKYSGPYWCDPERELLEIPMTPGSAGELGMASVMQGILGFFGLGARARLDRNRLNPEILSARQLRKRARDLVQREGCRTLVLTYSSGSLLPGNTPHVRSRADRDRFLARLDEFLTFFLGDLNGIAATPSLVHDWASTSEAVKSG